MRTKWIIRKILLVEFVFCLAGAVQACPPPPCPPCWGPWPACNVFCNNQPNKTCCNNSCCTNDCCYGSCFNNATKYCCGPGVLCNNGDGCCDSKACFDDQTKYCCNNGTGKTCNNDETCCGSNCCPPGQYCCDGITCYDPNEKQCCYSYSGVVCNKSCCDKWSCERCMYGPEESWCEPCLRKASDYEELMECSKIVDDPDTSPLPNGCSWSPEDPAGCGTTSFHNACNAHDERYQTCGNDKGSCDNAFLNALISVCASVPPGECRDDCIFWASWYVWAVEEYGDGAYEDDQVAACACCDC